MATVTTDTHTSALVAALGGASQPTDPRREQAVAALKTLSLPTRKSEDWKYTSLREVAEQTYIPAPVAALDSIAPYLIPGLDAQVMVFVNGHFDAALSSPTDVQVLPLTQRQGAAREVFEAHHGQVIAADTDIFAALNMAYAQEGTLVYVPEGQTLSRPIHIIHLVAGAADPVALQTRNLFVLGRGASAQVIESIHSTGSATSLHNLATEIVVGNHAVLEYVKLQQAGEQAVQIDRTEVEQGRDSRFSVYTFSVGGAKTRNNLIVRLQGRHTETHLMGATLLSGQQHVDHFTQMHHLQPDCFSNELYKGIVDGQATAVFNGKIHVYADAQKTNAFQSNRNILLSDSANVFTKPQLEIYADDVKCSHGATTGRIEEEAMFYLQARGIPEKQARLMLIHAFVMEVVENLTMEPLRDYIAALVDRRF